MYSPTTSESSAGDSSSESSAGPSHKRCRSPAATIISSIHVTRALVPSRADLLPPRKRFSDSISSEDSVEEDIDTDMLKDIEADATAVEVAVDRDVKAGIDACIAMKFDVWVDVEDEVEDEVESSDRGTMEVRVDVVVGIDIPDGMLMPNDMTITRSGMTPEAIEELVNRRVKEALAAYEATRAANALEAESQSQNGNDSDNGNGRNENGGNGNPNENNRDARPIVRECTYQDFMKCQPLNFNGTEGVFGLTRWFEKIETVFHISNCPEKYQVKYATCTLLNSALTWWNSHKRTFRTDATYAMSWKELMKLMAKIYCLRNEIQKMKSKLWNLIVKNNDLAAYTQRSQELTMMCTKMVPKEEDQPPFKRSNVRGQNVERAYTAGNNERKPYNRPLPLCNKYKLHHEGPSIVRCGKCNKCGRQGYYKNDCPKLKDQKCGNKAGKKNGIGEARGKAYVLGGGDANLDSNVVKDVSYAVELTNMRIYVTNTIIRGCTLGLLGHPFNIDLMPVELGSFDVIIGMDWLANHHAKETEDTSEEKRLKDVPTVRDFSKVSPWKEVIRFGKRGKLNPRYIGPFKILAKVGTLSYQLELPEQLSRFHSTFNVSNLKKCFVDETLTIPLDEIQIDDKLNFIEELVEIMDQKVKRLKQSYIPIIKVRWNSRRGPEFTLEREDQMKKKYPHLFR
nr:putative reverse transcriptase domain-containing protein [Tanacetum cinerariifolium]